LLAKLGLHVGAVILSTNEIGVVRAAIFGLERVAASIPFALAGPRTIAAVEIAVCATLIAGFAGCTGQKDRPFGVVARTEAFEVSIVDETVAVVVYAVATTVGVAIRAKDWKTTAGGARGPSSPSHSTATRRSAVAD
jgi:hypothetical protein